MWLHILISSSVDCLYSTVSSSCLETSQVLLLRVRLLSWLSVGLVNVSFLAKYFHSRYSFKDAVSNYTLVFVHMFITDGRINPSLTLLFAFLWTHELRTMVD
jgi:hypothetical protein